MLKEIVIEELEASEYDDIEEPILIKRKNQKKLFIVDEDYLDRLKDLEVIKGLLEAEEDKENGSVKNAREILKELRRRYE